MSVMSLSFWAQAPSADEALLPLRRSLSCSAIRRSRLADSVRRVASRPLRLRLMRLSACRLQGSRHRHRLVHLGPVLRHLPDPALPASAAPHRDRPTLSRSDELVARRVHALSCHELVREGEGPSSGVGRARLLPRAQGGVSHGLLPLGAIMLAHYSTVTAQIWPTPAI